MEGSLGVDDLGLFGGTELNSAPTFSSLILYVVLLVAITIGCVARVALGKHELFRSTTSDAPYYLVVHTVCSSCTRWRVAAAASAVPPHTQSHILVQYTVRIYIYGMMNDV
jgi:hypothetical protein